MDNVSLNILLSSKQYIKEKEYWLNKLCGNIIETSFPKDYFRVIRSNIEYKDIHFTISDDVFNKICKLSKNNDISIYILLLTSLKILINKYTSKLDIIVGSPILKGEYSENSINEIVALRDEIYEKMTIKECILKIRQTTLEAYENQKFPLFKIEEELLLSNNCTLFNTICLLENIHDLMSVKDTRTDIVFLFKKSENELKVTLKYNDLLFKKERIELILNHYTKILDLVVNNLDSTIGEISIISDDERNKICYEFNNSIVEIEDNKTVVELFEEQVEKTPENIAVSYNNEKLTYRELNSKANTLARVLRDKGVKADSIVGIMAERSIEMVVGIMSILKAGGAYLPLDPTWPAERKKYILNDGNVSILVTQSKLMDKTLFNVDIVDIYDNDEYKNDVCNLERINKSNDLAYVIYTSGSTGNPKGVLIEHKNLVNLTTSLSKLLYEKFDNYLNISLVSPYTFDASVKQMFASLLKGHSLFIVDEEARFNSDLLAKHYINNQIDISDGTPLHINMLTEAQKCSEIGVKYFIIGGDVLTYKTVKGFINKFKHNTPNIINIYGPTECCVDSIAYHIDYKEIEKLNFIPLGRQMANEKIYILDANLNMVHIGGTGEIYISGAGVGRGYLNRPELTKEKFIDNIFNHGERMYKTGDLGRWLPNGNVEFLGRADYQVKIRGYRIELGEIENQLLNYQDIKEAIVVDKEDENGYKYLSAYLVSNSELKISELRRYLSTNLPEYMIPTKFSKLDRIPLNLNGKVDRKSLIVQDESTTTDIVYEVPRNDVEEKLVSIWKSVLGKDKIGINDNFFEIGGHSLKATVLLLKIHKELLVEVPIREIFKSPTIKGIGDYINKKEKSICTLIVPIEDKEYYETSSAQKRMYAIQGFDKESIVYNMPQVFEVKGSIDKDKIEDIFRKLFDRHETLTTYFEVIDGQIFQKIDTDYNFILPNRLESGTIEQVVQDFIKPFDLSKAPLCRAEMVEIQSKNYLLIDMHHIISDGVSMGIIINEFVELYNGGSLEPLKLQYKDYAAWQNNLLKTEEIKKQEEYWINIFSDDIPVLNMPTDYERSAIQSFEGDCLNFKVDKNVTIKLKELTHRSETTMHMVLLSAFNILLSKYSGQEDIVIGTPIAGRTHADLQNIMGMFVNTLVLRNKPDRSKKYIDFLNEVKENSIKAYENQSYQLETLIEKLDIVRDTSKNPLFDVMFSMVDTVLELDIQLNDISLSPYASDNNDAKFDLTLNAMEQNEEIDISIGYCTKLFSKDSIERLGKHYIAILKSITVNSEIILGEIELLSNEEKNLILNKFNETKMEYPSDKTIHELFELQVKKTPDSIAIEFEDKKMTYNELNERSNSLAVTLRERGIKNETIVSIMVERSIDMIVGILAILKAGGAYLPIDPEQPKDRTIYILEECEVTYLLTQTSFISDIDYEVEIIDLHDEQSYTNEKSNLKNISNSGNLAYIIFTSGSTGLPKGAMIEHKSVVRLVKNTNYIEILSNDVILQLSNFAFDGSVFDIYGALLNGAKLVLMSKNNLLQVDSLGKVILDKKVSVFFVTTALFNTIVDYNIECLKNVRKVLFGGERVSVKHVKKALRYLGSEHIVHVYGPTEGTVYTTYYFIDTIENNAQNIPIGKSISNSMAYVLGKNNELLPVGVPGELCISGDGISRGYINSPELTSEKFINNVHKPDEIIYKTGDLVKWLPDGNLEFLGRIDNQVKVRGFRIELGEIENSLLQHKDVIGAAVTTEEYDDKDKYICAYVVSENKINEINLREYLSKILPHYMIPTFIKQVEKLTLNANGKLDKRTLPKLNFDINFTNNEAPRNELEEILVKIWDEVLGVNKVGINNSFFELGGHSLKAMTLISKIHKETNKEVPLIELFKSPTIKGISQYIENTGVSMYFKIKKIEKKEYYEASSAQKRMYIVQGFDKENTAYNMPQVFELQGSIDKTKIEDIFRKLVERHEALRTCFEIIEDEIVQKISNNYDVKLEEKVSHQSIEVVISEFVKAFKLEVAPLFRSNIVEVNDKTYLLIDMHHIISDGVSRGIIINEFVTLYNGGSLEPLKLQYKDFAAWQNNLLKSEEIKRQEEYWINMFKDEIPVLSIPTDYERPAVQYFEGDYVSFEVDKNITLKLIELTKVTGTTMHMILLSAFNILLSKYGGQEDIVIGTPIAGRPHVDLQNIMGMFVNTLALRNKPERSKKYIEFLKEVKENSLKAYDNQSYQLETLIEKLNIVRDTSRNPLFDVMFNMVDTVSDLDIKLKDMSLLPYGINHNVAKFDLTLNIMLQNDEIDFSIGYCTKLFNKNSIEKLGEYYLAVLESITLNGEIKLGEIELLSNEEKNLILHKFNDTETQYPRDKTIHELFELQVERIPDNIAVLFEDKKLTYRELNEKSNSLARSLRRNGVKEDTIVGIMIDRSLEMVVGIMGILKAGGAYLPIDPEHPKDRIMYMLKDSETKILLSKSNLVENIDFNGIVIDLVKEDISDRDISNLEIINTSKNLAYVIYTSGTTGNPKGVMIEHSALVNRLLWMQDKYPLTEEDTILQKTTYTFDVSVWELLWWSLVGAKVCMLSPYDEKDPIKIVEAINKYSITTMHFVPSMLDVFLYYLEESKKGTELNSLRQVFSSGEILNYKQVSRFYKEFGDSKKLINLYGPTEAAIDVSYFDTKSDSDVKVIPIGKPISNIKLYILDANRKSQPIGVAGELYIAGIGLARGYLNKPELTKEKFVENPFEPGTKMYKTGDLVRWLPHGNIEFLGRIDNQVKIRGFRIELGEIENKLLEHEEVKEAVALIGVGKDEDKYICAYIVSDKEVNELNLRNYLRESLPEYMVPSYFVKLEKMPITSNGKLDRRVLPKPNLDERITNYVDPRDDIEESLVKIWRKILGIDRIGINDNFFELGGHSLKAVLVVNLIQKEFGIKLSLRDIYNFSNISSLAKEVRLNRNHISTYNEIVPLPKQESYELSYAQKRLWILNQLEPNSIAYNMPGCFTLFEEVNSHIIQKVFGILVQRHEAFRTRFEEKDGVVVQIIDENVNFNIDKEDISLINHEEKKEKRKRIYEGLALKLFNLEVGPLIYVKLIKIADKEYDLVYCMHHIISDGWSLELLKNEFFLLYEGYKKGNRFDLGTLNIQYKEFASWQNKLIENKEISQQAKAFWHKQLLGENTILKLPVDYPANKLTNKKSRGFRIVLNDNRKDSLKEIAQENGTSLFVVMLATFMFFLSDLTKQKDILIGTPTFGRENVELQNIIGCFVNTTILKNEINEEESFIYLLKKINENTLSALEYQSYPLELVVEEMKIKYPKITAFFNMLNMFSESTREYIEDFNFYHIDNVQDVKFELVWYVTEYANGIEIMCGYLSELFEPLTIEYIMERYIIILDKILEDPNKLLKEYIADNKKRKLLK